MENSLKVLLIKKFCCCFHYYPMKILLFIVLFLNIFSQQDQNDQYTISECNIIQECKPCSQNFPSPSICLETGYYQVLNCSTIQKQSHTIVEMCIPDIRCDQNQIIPTILFQIFIIFLLASSCFYFYKRKNYLNDQRKERYSNLINN